MNILDVLQHHIDSDISKFYLRHRQYSRWALTIRKILSTSDSSFRITNNAALITCSRACIPRHPSGLTRFTASSIRIAVARVGLLEAEYSARSCAARVSPAAAADVLRLL